MCTRRPQPAQRTLRQASYRATLGRSIRQFVHDAPGCAFVSKLSSTAALWPRPLCCTLRQTTHATYGSASHSTRLPVQESTVSAVPGNCLSVEPADQPPHRVLPSGWFPWVVRTGKVIVPGVRFPAPLTAREREPLSARSSRATCAASDGDSEPCMPMQVACGRILAGAYSARLPACIARTLLWLSLQADAPRH